MPFRPENPLIVQSDYTLLLETMGPHFAEVRDGLARFAELVKSPEYMHTWKLTPLSLWNSAAAGSTIEEIIELLQRWAKYDIPPNVPVWIRETHQRYGRLKLLPHGNDLLLTAETTALMAEIRANKHTRALLGPSVDPRSSTVSKGNRGVLKQALVKIGHPVQDLAGFVDGDQLRVQLREQRMDGRPWSLRSYQTQAVEAFLAGPDTGGEGGSGVVVLPCGAGKTIVGLTAIARLGMRTLILCTNITALRQWREEIIDKTTLGPDDVCEYSGERKEVGLVTLTTYQLLTHRKAKGDEFVHMGLVDQERWGLIIYDEVHLLPAPVFRTVAQLQARRRLGLTATLVREDGCEGDVFALIGPKRFDVPWRDLEHQGWIATARCTEIRIGLPDDLRLTYAIADDREKFRLAATNPRKGAFCQQIFTRHPGARILVIGMYIDQLNELAELFEAPLITGETRQTARDQLFDCFRKGEVPILVISRVGNFSVDLPDANVAIQVSGTWGSRQEEAQRLGRVLRPKADGGMAYFYTIVSRDTTEQEFGERRQLFLTEQGYSYEIEVHA